MKQPQAESSRAAKAEAAVHISETFCLLTDLRTEQAGISFHLISPSERQKTTSHLKLK